MTTLRSAVFNVYFFVLTFVLGLGGVVLRLFAPQHALALAQLWARLALAGLARICHVTLRLEGAATLPRAGPALIASQHQSAYDTLVWLTLLPRPAYVMKQELTRIPLFGPLTVRAGMIVVDRAGGATALRDLIRRTRRAVAEGRQMVIFPEGTRTAPGQRVALQPGIAAMAAATGLPVFPVLTNSGQHWGRRAFRKRPGVIRVSIQSPIPAGLPRTELMRRLQDIFHGDAAAVVDNPVGGASAGLRSSAKLAS